jgi:hypothetical protein
MVTNTNFGFLERHDASLVILGGLAERLRQWAVILAALGVVGPAAGQCSQPAGGHKDPLHRRGSGSRDRAISPGPRRTETWSAMQVKRVLERI